MKNMECMFFDVVGLQFVEYDSESDKFVLLTSLVPLCLDIDECKGGNHGCEHGCVNMEGSFRCYCKEDYYLGDDQSSCFGKLKISFAFFLPNL